MTDKSEVIGYTKPGSNTESSASTINDISNLSNKDVLIFWGGTKAVSKNTSNNGLRYITPFVKNNNHTNIILLTVPHWYDLHAFSFVNNEFKNFNRKLMKYIKPDTHSSILEVYHNREYFTSHGLHLTGLGREVICNRNVSTAEKTLQFKEVKPISMYWKLGLVDNTNLNSTDICRESELLYRRVMLTMTAVVRKLKIKKEQGII
jgi:hypothetical protein